MASLPFIIQSGQAPKQRYILQVKSNAISCRFLSALADGYIQQSKTQHLGSTHVREENKGVAHSSAVNSPAYAVAP